MGKIIKMNQKIALKQLLLLRKDVKDMRLAGEQWPSKWQTLIAIILSARTRDEVTILVSKKLFSNYNSIAKLSHAKLSDIESILKPINFYKNKSKNVLNCAKKLVQEFNGEIPKTIDELITLPGVGRKTANVFLSEYGKDALGVDTHVFYVSKYLGWSKNNNPYKVEEDLKSLFPKEYWNKINSTLVRFGKTHTSRKKKNELLDRIKKIKCKK